MKRLSLVLGPPRQNSDGLREVYESAIENATDLLIASAYLTEWHPDLVLSAKTTRLVALIGIDFGLSRKSAMIALLKWLGRREGVFVGAVTDLQSAGFHPKVLAWRTQAGKAYCLIGSANLSRAAFERNVEASVATELSARQFERLDSWFSELKKKAHPIDADWIKYHYREAQLRTKSKRGNRPEISNQMVLPHGKTFRRAVADRRRQQDAFREIRAPLLHAIRTCAKGKLTRADFWDRFWELWSTHASRFQGSGLEILGKHANWRQACGAFVSILDAGPKTRDQAVVRALENLRRAKNPVRKAWFSEMLCHMFPDEYPVLNNPVRIWLRKSKWRGRRGLGEGERYLEIALKLRSQVRSRPSGARNLAEMDRLIWQIASANGWVKPSRVIEGLRTN